MVQDKESGKSRTARGPKGCVGGSRWAASHRASVQRPVADPGPSEGLALGRLGAGDQSGPDHTQAAGLSAMPGSEPRERAAGRHTSPIYNGNPWKVLLASPSCSHQ